MEFVSANGISLAWEGFGREGDPAVLLVSGLGTQMLRWTTAFCEELAGRGLRVIRFDNRDCGASTHLAELAPPDFGVLARELAAGRVPAVPYTLRDMAADTVGLLDGLRVRRAHLVGRSMGGMIAQIVAAEHPERVLSLTSIMSSTGNPALPAADPEVMAMMLRPRPDPAADPEGFAAASLAFARRIAGRGPFDEAGHRALLAEEIGRGLDPAGTARQIAAIAATGDRRAALARIAVPTLVIHGTEDPLIPPAGGEDTAASIPGARLLLLEGMGHDLPARVFTEVVDGICDLVRRAGAGGGRGGV